jgi:predicted small lipoprotein YifL
MQKNTLRILLFISLSLLLNGCGTKGPLYIPEQEYPQPAASS